MEVKCINREITPKIIDIYINNFLWKSVYSPYFSKLLISLVSEEGFKEKFIENERKKLVEVSLILLARRSYLKIEWEKKMMERMFEGKMIEEVYEKELKKFFFDEKQEVERRIEIYATRGKGRDWIEKKLEI